MLNQSLPKYWSLIKLKKALKNDDLISDGDWIESKDQDINGDVRLIQLADIGDSYFKNKSDRYMTNEKAINLNCTFLERGDILIARMPDPLGRACIFPGVDQKSVTVVDICLIRLSPNALFHPQLLTYWLNSPIIRDEIAQNATGTTRKRITRKKLEALSLPLPPLEEQKQIVAKLDELLARVDQIKTRLVLILPILKRFRQSVLSHAVRGKLTHDFHKNDIYEDGYPKSWKNKSLSDLGKLARGKSKHRPRNDPKLFGDKYPFIQTGEVANSGGIIKFAKNHYSDFGLSQSKLFPRDTLCITIAANIADTAILDIDACFPDSIVGFIADEKQCSAQYIKYLIDSNKDNLESFAPATAQKNINLKVLNELLLPIPSLQEQMEIIQRAEKLFSFVDRVEEKITKALSKVNNLTQSILSRAFNGELTAEWRNQNIELIGHENFNEELITSINTQCKKMTV